MQSILEQHCHHLPADEVAEVLGTDVEKGLDVFETSARQQRFGPNVITRRKGHGPLVRFLLQFNQPLVYILLIAGAVTAVLQEWVDSGVIFGVVVINAIIGFLQEAKALEAIEALARVMTSENTVIRGGEKKRIPSAELVPGDIVLLQSGDRVPADMRLFRTRDLQIDESALTGESLPVEKNDDVLAKDTMLVDRKNMAYSSAMVTYGTGSGIVVATGDKTEIGRISELIATAEIPKTPLTRKIAHFSGILLYVVMAFAGLTFVVGLLRGQPWLEMFMAAVALAVAAIPEGLPAVVTITLAIGVSRMARQRAIVRRLPAVETLGSTTVICSDKTGTLTQNQMTVRKILAGDRTFEVSGQGFSPEGEIRYAGAIVSAQDDPVLSDCLTAGLLCNDSVLRETDDGWKVEGDPTEGALIASAVKSGISAQELNGTLPRLDSIPFESQHQYMATMHDTGPGQARLVYIKGSVESLIEMCSFQLDPAGKEIPLENTRIQKQAEEMSASGLRVIALARSSMPPETGSLTHGDIQSNLVFLGLQGMIDPPRPEAIDAIKACRSAGIRVKMITGDHPITAAVIARQLGLYEKADYGPDQPILTGRAIMELSDTQLIEKAESIAVFARVTPEQKLRLVEALQVRGYVVAMTGDGVNDAPALRRADIGVAMGMAGTEVAKEAADVVLTDDNFASIEAAVEEGRGVFDNLTKFIVWTLPTNVGEGLLILTAIALGTALPILPAQILWINMTTSVMLGLMLAFEPKEPDIMRRSPREPKAPILTSFVVVRIVIVSLLMLIGAFGLFEYELINGSSESTAWTVAVGVIVFTELFYLFNSRSLTESMFGVGLFSNRPLILGVIGMIVLQLAYTYLPIMNLLFHSEPIGLDAWIRILLVGMTVYVVVFMEKQIRRILAKRRVIVT